LPCTTSIVLFPPSPPLFPYTPLFRSRRPQKRADYLLRYRRDFPIAVVEAKAIYSHPGDGLQQAKEYAQILGLKFAYATNGRGIEIEEHTSELQSRFDVVCRRLLEKKQ